MKTACKQKVESPKVVVVGPNPIARHLLSWQAHMGTLFTGLLPDA